MGNSNSVERERENQRILYNKAVELYTQRLRNYNYAYHGNYSRYLQNIQAQFQLDCIPEYLKYGQNYVQRDDNSYYDSD
jgi:hypothetical protein